MLHVVSVELRFYANKKGFFVHVTITTESRQKHKQTNQIQNIPFCIHSEINGYFFPTNVFKMLIKCVYVLLESRLESFEAGALGIYPCLPCYCYATES